jgi:chromosome segregation ATPase
MMEIETLLREHPLFCSAIAVTGTTLYFRIQGLLTEEKGHAPYGQVGKYQADDITVASTFSTKSSQEVRELQSKLTMCEEVIQSLQKELRTSANESEQTQASLETERIRASVMEEEGEEAKQLLEKECAKVLNLQSMHSASRSEFHELSWDEAGTMISLVKVQKQVYELDSQISYERLRLINKHKILEVEKNRTSTMDELVGARSNAEMFLKTELQKIEASHRALEESICIIEENQEKLSSDQFQAYDVQDKLMREVKNLESKVAAKETVNATQKQQLMHLQRLNEAENQKAENNQTAGKLKLEAIERKLQASTKENDYQKKRSEDLRDLHSAEKDRADRLEGDQSNTNAIVRLKDTKIEALEMKITTIKEKETAHEKQIENLRKMHSDAKEKIARHQSQESKLSDEKMERENALEKVNLKMEEKLEAIAKQKNQLQHFEQAHAEEQAKANKINQQLPQLLNLIKTEETKGLKLQQLLQETNVLLQTEKFKVEGLEKGLATMSAMMNSKEGKIETLERDRFNRLMQSNQTGEQQGDKKGWFWKQ